MLSCEREKKLLSLKVSHVPRDHLACWRHNSIYNATTQRTEQARISVYGLISRGTGWDRRRGRRRGETAYTELSQRRTSGSLYRVGGMASTSVKARAKPFCTLLFFLC